jgi:hypothetical protein
MSKADLGMEKLSFLRKKLPFILSLLIVLFVLNCIKNVKYWKRDGPLLLLQ